MPNIFPIFALLLAALALLLYVAPEKKLLNFVDYGGRDEVRRLNRYAAVRLLVPAGVNLGCAYLAAREPALTVPLLFLTPLSILGIVIWIGARVRRVNAGVRSELP